MSNHTINTTQQQWQQRWQAIEQAGGRYQYVQQQLKAKGFLVERQPIDRLSPVERERYKKILKQEAEAQRQLKKEAWQAYKATHIVHLGQGIYWSDDTSEDKWDAPNASNRLVENQLPIFKNPQQLAESLKLTIPQLKGLCYQQEVATHLPYHCFTIPKRNGSERQIWAPIPRLKHAQRWILDNILNPLVVHGSAHGFIRNKSIVTNARVHTNSQLIIKLDIKDFFPSVNWRRVKGVFRQAGYNQQISTLLAMLCTESPRQVSKHNGVTYYIALDERCLPQGAPTSPALTNIVCLNLDRRLTGLATKHQLRYSRYADDLTLSLPVGISLTADDERLLIKQILGSIAKILQEEGFILHPDKIRIIRQANSQQVTGLVVNGAESPRVPRKIKRMLRAAIFNLQQGKPLPENESVNRLQGYIAWVAMTEPLLAKKWTMALKNIKNADN